MDRPRTAQTLEKIPENSLTAFNENKIPGKHHEAQ